ncbi:putative vacuolar membrane protein [Lachnellula occidentalis]|uniref:Putative vacuolar membrane protein n=1 Tax=Lachnellula occidentalis TaxID=215460 RepID=A0A8H8RLG7_9HELO|nr:putative vacuolar membrane protein [Lachnellula occidentalis]
MSHSSHPVPVSANAQQRPVTPVSASLSLSRTVSLDPNHNEASKGEEPLHTLPDDDDFSDWDAEVEHEGKDTDMDDRRPLHRQTDGRSHQPLLRKDSDVEARGRSRGSGYNTPEAPERPSLFTRRSTMRSRSPDTQAKLATRKKYTYAAFFLGLSLVSFTIQTETAVYIQHEMGWNKAYCMLYLTHGSWSLLWPFQLLCLRLQKWNMPWHTFWRRHVYLVRTTAQMIELQDLSIPRGQHSPIPYILRKTALVTCALTVAGGSWYVAVNLTSPSDLTAIYNCSAFFAYAFSVPILKEKLRFDKSFAVLVAIVGVLTVAYGDSKPTKHGGKSGGSVGGGEEKEASNRLLGNLIIGVGSVLYGFYEVLYKRLACPPEGISPGRGMIFANTFGSLIGSFTLLVLWFPLPILHFTGLEKFELPTGNTAWLLLISVLSNATFSGSFLVLISLTSPVLSSVAALLTIFLVAIVDWLWTGVPLAPAAIAGGILIIAAFLLLSWSTYREMTEDIRKKQVDLSESDDSDRNSDD